MSWGEPSSHTFKDGAGATLLLCVWHIVLAAICISLGWPVFFPMLFLFMGGVFGGISAMLGIIMHALQKEEAES